MARPVKYDIPNKQVEDLASFGCTNVEIAYFFGCDESLIRKNYSENLTKGRAKGKVRLRQAQMRKALGTTKIVIDKETKKEETVSNNDGNPSMMIWLGKQMLGQSENPLESDENLPSGFELNVI